MRYVCLLLVLAPLALIAADPVGRITSSGPLTLDGKAVPVTAASSLPLVAGDEVATSSFAATIFFADSSRATIAPNSRVKVEPNGSSVTLRVLAGSADLNRAKSSQIKLIAPPQAAAQKAAAAGASPDTATASDHDCKPHHRSKKCPQDKDCDKDCDKD